jgi:hypothetical protein
MATEESANGMQQFSHQNSQTPNHQRFQDFDLHGKVLAVTGGGRGLGLTMAEALVEAGGQGRKVSLLIY